MNVIISVNNLSYDIVDIAEALKLKGVAIRHVLTRVGVILANIKNVNIAELKTIEGVIDVRNEQTVTIPTLK